MQSAVAPQCSVSVSGLMHCPLHITSPAVTQVPFPLDDDGAALDDTVALVEPLPLPPWDVELPSETEPLPPELEEAPAFALDPVDVCKLDEKTPLLPCELAVP